MFLVFVTKLISGGHTRVRLENTEVPAGQGEIRPTGGHHSLGPASAASHTHNGHTARCVVHIGVSVSGEPFNKLFLHGAHSDYTVISNVESPPKYSTTKVHAWSQVL